MSKLGRYSADRKKIEQLTTTATAIQVADCGTIFMLKGTDYSADVTHSLPHPSEAGKGWWCKFIVEATGSTAEGGDVLDLGGDDCNIKIRGPNVLTFVDNLLVLQIHETAGATGLSDTDADFVLIKGECVAGSQLEFVCDGSKYYLHGSNTADGNITVDT